MLKNNKILKAQMGISLPASGPGWTMNNLIEWLTAGGLETASAARTAASTVARGASSVPTSIGNLATIPVGLAAYAMTRPHAASGAVQRAHRNQLAKEKEKAIRKEQQYWNNKADFYSNALSNGVITTPTGVVITEFDPSTGTISGYKDVRNGDRIFLDQNLQTGIYSNPVYKDAKTGAYYEGTLDLNGTIPIVGRGKNLMPYSIIPVEKPEWMVSNPSDILKLPVPIVFNEEANNPTPNAASSTSQTSGSASGNPESPDPENKSKLKQIWEILKGKSNASSNTSSNSSYSRWEKVTLQDKDWLSLWFLPKAVLTYLRYVAPTEATLKAIGWMPINSGPTYQLFPSLRPTMDRIANTNSQPENQTQQQKNTEKEELPKIPIGYRQNSTRSNLQDSTISQDSTYTW